MAIKLKTVALSLVLLWAHYQPQAIAQDECKDILQDGIYETKSSKSDEQLISAFTNWYYSRNASSSTSKTGSRSDIEGSFKSFLASSKGSKYAGTTKELEEVISNYVSGDSTHTAMIANFSRYASTTLAEEWGKCMNRYGLHVSLKRTYDSHKFWLIFRFRAPSDKHKANLLAIEPDSPKILNCNFTTGSAPEGGKTAGPKQIGPADYPVLCKRSKNMPVSIGLTADTAFSSESSVFSIPAVPKFAPPKKSLPNGLVACWSGNSNLKDVVGGSTSKPINLSYVSTMYGEGFVFSANDDPPGTAEKADAIKGMSTRLPTGDDPRTIVAWARTDKKGETQLVFHYGSLDGEGTRSYHLFIQSNGIAAAGNGKGEGIVGGTTNVADGKWHHIASSTTGKTGATNIFVDGHLEKSGSIRTPTTNSGSFTIGSSLNRDAGNDFVGTIDEVMVFDRALTLAEIEVVKSIGQCP